MDITLDESGEVFVTYTVEDWQDRQIRIDLVADFGNHADFIEKTGVRSLNELATIKYSTFLKQYVRGKGYVSCCLHYMNSIDVHFWVLRGKTQISCRELHWYDEMVKALTLPDQFVEYINPGGRRKVLWS